jgi:hypothetical protein
LEVGGRRFEDWGIKEFRDSMIKSMNLPAARGWGIKKCNKLK